MARGGTPDPDCPNDVNSYRYWAYTGASEQTVDENESTTQVVGRVNPADAIHALAFGPAPVLAWGRLQLTLCNSRGLPLLMRVRLPCQAGVFYFKGLGHCRWIWERRAAEAKGQRRQQRRRARRAAGRPASQCV